MIGNILVDSAGSMENRHQVLPPIPIEDNRISVSLNIGNQIPQIPSELTKRSGPQSGKPTNTQCTPCNQSGARCNCSLSTLRLLDNDKGIVLSFFRISTICHML